MRLTHRHFLSVASALPLIACSYADTARPSGEAESVGETQSAETVKNPLTLNGTATVGTGYSQAKEQLAFECVTSSPLNTGPAAGNSGQINLNRRWSKSEAESSLGLEVGAKGRYLIASANINAKTLSTLQQDEYSSTFVYGGDFVTKYEGLTGNATLTPIGQAALMNGTFAETCGDQFVWQREFGGRFLIVERLDFDSLDAKKTFEVTTGLSASAAVASGELNVKISGSAHDLAKHAALHVEAIQIGGKPQFLGAIVTGGGTVEKADGGGRAFLDCSLEDMDACKTFFSNAITYFNPNTTNGFGAQLADAPVPTKYILHDWSTFPGVNAVPIFVLSELAGARNDLSRKFEAIYANYPRMNRLLTEDFEMSTEQRAAIQAALDATTNALVRVNDASAACYDRLIFKKTDTGTSMVLDASSINACITAVAAVPVPQVPSEVLNGAAFFEIQGRRRRDPWLGANKTEPLCHPGGCSQLDRGIQSTDDLVGRYQEFVNGVVYWSPDSGAWAVARGTVLDKWTSTRREKGILGYPISDATALPNAGQVNWFQHGGIFVHGSGAAHELHGQVLDRWWNLGIGTYQVGRWQLGYPTSDVLPATNGEYATFEGGAIYESHSRHDEAHAVLGPFNDAFVRAGRERQLGYPVEDVTAVDNVNQFYRQNFENGSVQSSPAGTFWLGAQLTAKFNDASVGGAAGFRGAPISDEGSFWNTRGVRLLNGYLLWSQATGAHTLDGWFMDEWLRLPAVASALGLPTSDTFAPEPGSRFVTQSFQHGAMYAYGPHGRAYSVFEPFFAAYSSAGGPNGCLGLPINDEAGYESWTFTDRNPRPFNYIAQNFEHGVIVRNWCTGATTCYPEPNVNCQ